MCIYIGVYEMSDGLTYYYIMGPRTWLLRRHSNAMLIRRKSQAIGRGPWSSMIFIVNITRRTVTMMSVPANGCKTTVFTEAKRSDSMKRSVKVKLALNGDQKLKFNEDTVARVLAIIGRPIGGRKLLPP
uniref:SUI1 domain-containing protein n=1 Tax=Trichuris muris TaxID=70415 RepID=A0A5S6R0A7_TRIMR